MLNKQRVKIKREGGGGTGGGTGGRSEILMCFYGISGDQLLWIRNCLSHRRQQDQVNSTLSNWENVTNGVPQGSVFRSVFFVIYSNELPRDTIVVVVC